MGVLYLLPRQPHVCREWAATGACSRGRRCYQKATHTMEFSPRYVEHMAKIEEEKRAVQRNEGEETCAECSNQSADSSADSAHSSKDSSPSASPPSTPKLCPTKPVRATTPPGSKPLMQPKPPSYGSLGAKRRPMYSALGRAVRAVAGTESLNTVSEIVTQTNWEGGVQRGVQHRSTNVEARATV